ncbi:MAG: AAA family ATPase [Proteobacteria bacterium]|nr:AAA family ATPase [Pseudomonadota bacterium]MCK4485212.1 AAA family ATPase [Desulfobacterales bacterium]
MYKSFTIKNFRCFSKLTIEPLERVNLVAGMNNVGKTALLEALWLHHGYQNPSLGLKADIFRGVDRFKLDEIMWTLFLDFDPSRSIEISSIDFNDLSAVLKINIRQLPSSVVPIERAREMRNRNDTSGPAIVSKKTEEQPAVEVLFDYSDFSGHHSQARAFPREKEIEFISGQKAKETLGIYLAARVPYSMDELAERLGNLQITKKENQVVRILQIIEPSLVDLNVLPRGGAPLIFGDIQKERLVPLPLMGDGMMRLLNMALSIKAAPGGILLVDEIENGIHHSLMVKVWTAISQLARECETQIVATTHSRECIIAAAKAFTQSDEFDFRYHRFEKVDGEIRSVAYDRDALEGAIEIDLEMR